MPVEYAGLPFDEQIQFFRDKLELPSKRWSDIYTREHDFAFVVAGATKGALLTDLRQAVQRAIEDGTTLEQFRRDFDAIVRRRGWTGWTGEGSKAGRAWRTRVIYETNLRTSYAAGRYQQAKEAGTDALVHFEDFADGLRRHIGWEEEHLFPLFEERTGVGQGGPTEVMRREHRRIEGLLEAMRQDLKAGSPPIPDENEDVLLDMLAQHNVKEEQVLYPSIDNLLSEDEVANLFSRLTLTG